MNRKLAIARRMREVREELFGVNGIDSLAEALSLPAATWQNYESGVNIPGEAMLAFLVVFGVDAGWLLTGEGQRFFSTDRGFHAVRN